MDEKQLAKAMQLISFAGDSKSASNSGNESR